MLGRRFPQLGFDRQKKRVSTNFFSERMMEEGPEAWRASGGTPVLSGFGVVDAVALKAAVETSFARRQRQDATRIWDLLNVEAWLRPRVRSQ